MSIKMTNTIDISVLFDKPELNHKASLFIEPLAPLSLVTSMPGAYYRSQREPSDFMIYGMLENLLGWHFTDDERNPIITNLKSHYKKQYKLNLNFAKTPVGYKPLLQHHLKIEQLLLKPSYYGSYEDYWTQHLKHNDIRHFDGSRNYDYSLEQEVNILKSGREELKIIKSKSKTIRESLQKEANKKKQEEIKKEIKKLEADLMKKSYEKMSNYYSSPKTREYIIVKNKYGYIVTSTPQLLKLLNECTNQLISPLYLGTNEGWVDLKIESL